MSNNILLESGTNEFEIVEFTVGGTTYGINVAKVREVINKVPITSVPKAHQSVDGLFTLRGRVIPLLNLPRFLGASDDKGKQVIISELNNIYVGFLVDEVFRIHRISWKDLEPPPTMANANLVVGIINRPDKVILLLDFEQIVSEINPEMKVKLQEVSPATPDLASQRAHQHIVIAEDSCLISDLLKNTLNSSGYSTITMFKNGEDAWNALETCNPAGVITDIEMPQMDGHHFLKRIRETDKFKNLPVVIFSSLISPEMKLKGESLGATAQISKPEIHELITTLDKILIK